MSDPAPSDRLRLGALSMLADGNSVEAVAQMLGMPVDTVIAWRSNPVPAPRAGQAAPTSAPRFHFQDTLSHGMSLAARATVMVALGVVLIVAAALLMPRGPGATVDHWEDAWKGALLCLVFARLALGLARRQVVLGPHSVFVAQWWGSRSMPYAEISDYTLHAAERIHVRSAQKGRWLIMRSRRPGAEPLQAWIFDAYPFDPRIVERLNEVVFANRGLDALSAVPTPPPPPAPGLDATEGASRRLGLGFVKIGALLVCGLLVPLLPVIDGAVRSSMYDLPPLASLRHVEGLVDTASECVDGTFDGRSASVLHVDVLDRAGTVHATLPCLVQRDTLLRGGRHRLALDLDPASNPPNRVFQVALDGRVLLSYATSRGRFRQTPPHVAWGIVFAVLALVGMILAIMREAWVKRFDGNDD